MELISAIIKECSVSMNIPLEINLLQQLLPELAQQERMLKIRSKRNESTAECSRINEEDASIKNNRCKYSRMKRKMMKLTNFSGRHDSIHQNGHYTTRGRVQLPLLREPPTYLKYLLGKESGKVGTNFRKNIRAYNSLFAFTSMGGRVDGSINRSKRPYVFRMSGQNYHHIGSLLPEIGKTPRFSQLYIYDTENEITNRMNCLWQGDVDPKIVHALSEMLDEHNNSIPNLHFSCRDNIVEHRKKGLQRITDLHPNFMSMTYPLIHPFGEDGYRLGINLAEVNNKTQKRQNLSMREFYCFRIQKRLNEGPTLLLAGRLLQQYIVDAYMAIEEERFRHIRNNKKKLKVDLYSGLMDAIRLGDSDSSMIGKSIILPSSHTGGPRYRAQNYQDAMAICRWAGYLDLFLTFTCNRKWPEINEMLHLIGQHDDNNRVDIICRVFRIKLFQLMQDLKKQQPFGKIIACLYTIEFQKRGLPHTHILLFLHPTLKSPSIDHINTIITAEIPDMEVDPDGYNAQGKCSKRFPKKFNNQTTFDEDGFPIYRRRNTGTQVKKNNVLLDNRYVVPYNRNLIVKFDAHINIELCNYSRSMKYLFKYINKGSDRATATIECTDTAELNDKIKRYLDCRYISATKACWRIFKFDIHHREPAVERLPFHLQGENTIVFEEEERPKNIIRRPNAVKTKFTEWFTTNQKNDDARELTYSEFPTHWVWDANGKKWNRRKMGKAVGRIYFAHPASGERFYMRMLLNFVKGSTFFESIRTINGVSYKTYKEACYALGLLEDDKEWNDCLAEAACWASGNELRNLFVTILIHCQVSDSAKLWRTNYEILSEDITSLQRKRFQVKDLQLTEKQLEAYTLFELETILVKMGKSLKDIDGIPLPDSALLSDRGSRLINKELDYDKEDLKKVYDKSFALLNDCQKSAYEAIMASISNEEGCLFFIMEHGGIGKIFLWNTIILKLRLQSKILAELLLKTSLIIWDKAAMVNKFCFEALDRTLRDILRVKYENNSDKPFGGLTVVFGGDFRQILPAIPKETCTDIIDALLNSSYLWLFLTVYELKQNMRLCTGKVTDREAAEITTFDKWLLQIGDGSFYDDVNNELIKLPPDICITSSNDPIDSIVEAAYPSLLQNYNDPAYLKERAILTPKNEMVQELNDTIMKMIQA
ncbi:hypothetical protein P3S68_015007 [Capsicum galapagoense]